MHIDFLLNVFREVAESEAFNFRGRAYTYRWLTEQVAHWRRRLAQDQVASGTVAILRADFSPNAVALLLALIERGCIVVPITSAARENAEELVELAQGKLIITVDPAENVTLDPQPLTAAHDLYARLREAGHAGLVLFSSGTTGRSKGAVHDFSRLLKKYHRRRHNLRTIAFLLFDHIGGLDTLFYSLSNGSTLVVLEDRSPEEVCRAVEKHRVQVLPVAPTFLNLLLLSEAYKRYDLSSLRYITYGAEVMPEETLRRCARLFPDLIIQQKYGTTEVGTLRSRSKSSDSLWVQIGGEGYQCRVVDGMLEIKADSAMLGYINAPSPFTPDGWFKTGDCVEVDGDYFRILGRRSDIINVGGQKVYPAEVENVIREMSDVADVTVYGEQNMLVGSIVCAKVQLFNPEDLPVFRPRLQRFCAGKLEPYKVPVKVTLSEEQSNSRFKKIRRQAGNADGVA